MKTSLTATRANSTFSSVSASMMNCLTLTHRLTKKNYWLTNKYSDIKLEAINMAEGVKFMLNRAKSESSDIKSLI